MNVSVLGGARWTKSWAESCIDHNRKVFDWIKNNPGVKYVVLSSPFVFPGRTILETGREVSNNPEIIRSHLIETINNVRSIGKKVVIISAPPNNGENLGDCFYKSLRFGFAAEECDFEASDFSRNTIDGYSLLKSIEHLVPVIWLDKMICQDGVCKVSEKGMPIYRDGGHLSLVGSAKIGQEFDIGSYVIDESY
jgi:hypothetical protein